MEKSTFQASVKNRATSKPFVFYEGPPFLAEVVYRRLCGESVHLQDYPKHDATLLDPQLEQQMANVLAVVVLGTEVYVIVKDLK